MKRLYISLEDDEVTALRELAQRERRDIRQQAALALRAGLVAAGMLPSGALTLDLPASKAADLPNASVPVGLGTPPGVLLVDEAGPRPRLKGN